MKLFRKDDKVKIQSRFKEYEVIFEDNKVFLKDLVSKPNSEIVVDKNVYELYKDCFEEIPSERLFVVEDNTSSCFFSAFGIVKCVP